MAQEGTKNLRKSHVQIGAIPAKQSEALHLTQTISRNQNQREMALKIRIGEHCTHIIHSLSTSRNMDPISSTILTCINAMMTTIGLKLMGKHI
jgi:hypothetical protein